uniref:Protein kinase domain-containing protein n=1 Tax=Ananas comosus var. bracteatus TaxID=296719 RepID=A0A6V7NFE9_ANACO|nr:unnamed protein product [Ananas comosus var. bracteatus]
MGAGARPRARSALAGEPTRAGEGAGRRAGARGLVSASRSGSGRGRGEQLIGNVIRLFNAASVGTPNEGATWLRLQRLAVTWHRILLIPVTGGVVVGMMHGLLEIFEQIKQSRSTERHGIDFLTGIFPTIKAVQAAVTLGDSPNLFSRRVQPVSWAMRVNIATDIARVLSFLHRLDTQVIFRDLKPSNVLLDSDFRAKLSDFGLARNGPAGDKSHVSTQNWTRRTQISKTGVLPDSGAQNMKWVRKFYIVNIDCVDTWLVVGEVRGAVYGRSTPRAEESKGLFCAGWKFWAPRTGFRAPRS